MNRVWMVTPLLAACVPPVPSGAAQAGGSQGGVEAVFQGINAHRQRGGCAPLVWSDAAARAAQLHSADMARRRYFSHTSPEGSQPWDRARAQGIAFSRAAENIVMTQAGARDAVRLWIGSPGHRANIENCALTHTGVGVSGDYWTQFFFTPAAR
ncbi:MAG TPA: CAP domain-containing protein [Longimicrobium sp.]